MWKKTRNRRVSGITFIRYAQNHKIGKPNNFKVFGSNKTKGHKQDNQNRLRSYTPEGGEGQKNKQKSSKHYAQKTNH
jgi:hypothetical protein